MPSPNLIIDPTLAFTLVPKEFSFPSLDVRHFLVGSLGIDEVRDIKSYCETTAFRGEKKTVVIGCRKITVEAQNALLKLFEETPKDCVFYLIIPHESLLLPTLRSRFTYITKSQDSLSGNEGDKFLSLSYKDRLELIAEKAKEEPAYLEELPIQISIALNKRSNLNENKKSKQTLLLCESYVRLRGASRKMLLENLALSLPIEKM